MNLTARVLILALPYNVCPQNRLANKKVIATRELFCIWRPIKLRF